MVGEDMRQQHDSNPLIREQSLDEIVNDRRVIGSESEIFLVVGTTTVQKTADVHTDYDLALAPFQPPTDRLRDRSRRRIMFDMPAGWSQLVIRSDKGKYGCDFYFELLDHLGRGAPAGVKFSATPPAATQPASRPAE